MVQLELSLILHYDVQAPVGADFVFNVQAAQTPQQHVLREQLTLNRPMPHDLAIDRATANRTIRLHAEPGVLQLEYQALIAIEHHVADPDTLVEVPVRALPLAVMPYIYPSRYCQSDRLLKFAHDEFGALAPGWHRVAAVQQWVQRHISFRSNTSNSSTSALDTLVDRVGVCRDFTHLFIALCRALNLPARMVSGTDYGADPALGPPDFHAYAEVFLGDRWYLFDPSGTGIPMGFVRLGTGRDAADIAFATIFGAVHAAPPRIAVRACTGAALETPALCRGALSTTPAWPCGPLLAAAPSDASAPAGRADNSVLASSLH